MLIPNSFLYLCTYETAKNMILNQLNQYRNLYLQAMYENTRLKHAMSKHEDELKAGNQSVIESLEDRIREQGEELNGKSRILSKSRKNSTPARKNLVKSVKTT